MNTTNYNEDDLRLLSKHELIEIAESKSLQFPPSKVSKNELITLILTGFRLTLKQCDMLESDDINVNQIHPHTGALMDEKERKRFLKICKNVRTNAPSDMESSVLVNIQSPSFRKAKSKNGSKDVDRLLNRSTFTKEECDKYAESHFIRSPLGRNKLLKPFNKSALHLSKICREKYNMDIPSPAEIAKKMKTMEQLKQKPRSVRSKTTSKKKPTQQSAAGAKKVITLTGKNLKLNPYDESEFECSSSSGSTSPKSKRARSRSRSPIRPSTSTAKTKQQRSRVRIVEKYPSPDVPDTDDNIDIIRSYSADADLTAVPSTSTSSPSRDLFKLNRNRIDTEFNQILNETYESMDENQRDAQNNDDGDIATKHFNNQAILSGLSDSPVKHLLMHEDYIALSNTNVDAILSSDSNYMNDIRQLRDQDDTPSRESVFLKEDVPLERLLGHDFPTVVDPRNLRIQASSVNNLDKYTASQQFFRRPIYVL